MKVQVVGCSHHNASIEVRERLAFTSEEMSAALDGLRREYAGVEAVLLSTCNRVELYSATEDGPLPSREQLAGFLARFHGLAPAETLPHLSRQTGKEAVEHLFAVASSLDSMVVGEGQILSQVKEAYQAAVERATAGPLMHAVFQASLKVARRIAGETDIQRHRVSIPSVAVADFARQIFERFDDKNALVIGAGEMAEETLRYLRDEGVRDVTVVNRSADRAAELARRWHGRTVPWDRLSEALGAADLVIGTTGSGRPIVTLEQFLTVEPLRRERPLFVLDLAVPRDFDPAIGARPEVYLYSIDDLRTACERNRREREKELPQANQIIQQETDRFMADVYHRATGPVIRQLEQGWRKSKDEELERLLGKLPELDPRERDEIRRSFDRLLGKLLHPPLESLRDESRHGIPHALLDALSKLFRLRD